MKIKAESLIRLVVRRFGLLSLGVGIATAAISLAVQAQSCSTSSELDDNTRAAITGAAQRYFQMAAKGDVNSLRQNVVPTRVAGFAGTERQVKARQRDLSGAQPRVQSVFLLQAEGSAPIAHPEFDCGVFGQNGQTAGSAVFNLEDVATGKYGIVLMDATSPGTRTHFSVILQPVESDWKLGDLFIEPAQAAGHDSQWFVERAAKYKAEGKMHNAWLYLLEARSLISPMPFMSTLATDKLYDEAQKLRPVDFPMAGKTADLSASGSTYKLTAIFPKAAENDLDLIVKYQAADISDGNQTYKENVALIKALVTKYPELREAFAGVVARAVEPGGRDYGTLLAMKDLK
jgi:hypothetical protein